MANGKIKVRGKKDKGNFVDFILEVQKDRDLLTRFMQITDPKDLKNFFDNEGFNDISEEDAVKILEFKKNLENQLKGQLGGDYY